MRQFLIWASAIACVALVAGATALRFGFWPVAGPALAALGLTLFVVTLIVADRVTERHDREAGSSTVPIPKPTGAARPGPNWGASDQPGAEG